MGGLPFVYPIFPVYSPREAEGLCAEGYTILHTFGRRKGYMRLILPIILLLEPRASSPGSVTPGSMVAGSTYGRCMCGVYLGRCSREVYTYQGVPQGCSREAYTHHGVPQGVVVGGHIYPPGCTSGCIRHTWVYTT